ncbi:hypothetical protein GGR50DRAFT_677406 [Xylaria sp. CBS 124048]|nr:hypothetical protein GGR50DRAFT_677406 [Xylaria sp. CBS 124048]
MKYCYGSSLHDMAFVHLKLFLLFFFVSLSFSLSLYLSFSFFFLLYFFFSTSVQGLKIFHLMLIDDAGRSHLHRKVLK